MSGIVALAVGALLLVFQLTEASPSCRLCTCRRPPPPTTELANAAAVFAGRVEVISSDDSIPARDSTWSPAEEREWFARLAEQRQIRLRVSRVWKGSFGETAIIVTGGGGGDCSFEFTVGEEYLVYVFPARRGGLYASSCSRTRRLANAADDLRDLGAGWPVARRVPKSKQRPHN